MISRFPRRIPWLCVLALLAAGASCRSREQASPAQSAPPPDRATGRAPVAAPPAARPKIVILGDSLTAGLGLAQDEAYPALLQQRLDGAGYRFDVVNAGVSGDTSAGGLSRLDWSLDGDVRILVVALGGNDGLRGLPPEDMKQNLAEIIRRARARRIAVLLAGMETPTNMGPDYQRRFHDVFPALAEEYRTAFLPFLLQDVAGRPELNQRDGIHPTAQGARIVADHVWRVLEPMVRTASQ